jgi:hypothetical protein
MTTLLIIYKFFFKQVNLNTEHIKSYTIFTSLILLLSIFVGCKKENSCDCIKRTGSIESETRTLAAFEIVEVENNFNLYLIQDSVSFVEIHAGKNLISNIETTIANHKLLIKNNNKCNFTRSYKKKIEIYLHFKKLNELVYKGTGPITSINTIYNDSFTFNSWDGTDSVKLNLEVPLVYANIHTGVADLIVNGHAQQLYAYARSNGTFRMKQFICKNVYTNNLSASDHFFNVQNKLEALVQYVGNTYYLGNPTEVIKTENNAGKLISLN